MSANFPRRGAGSCLVGSPLTKNKQTNTKRLMHAIVHSDSFILTIIWSFTFILEQSIAANWVHILCILRFACKGKTANAKCWDRMSKQETRVVEKTNHLFCLIIRCDVAISAIVSAMTCLQMHHI